MTLRPYQEHDVQQMREAIAAGHRRVLLVAPTGSGKGVVCAYMISRAVERGKRVQFWVGRRTLVHDMAGRVKALGLDHGVIMAGVERAAAPIQIASADTLRRMTVMPPADMVILDEAHMAVTDGYQDLMDRYPDAVFILLTATPIRKDGHGLGEIADVMVQGPSVQSLIDQKYLVPSRVMEPAPPVELAGVDVSVDARVAAALNRPHIVGDLVKTWLLKANNRKSAYFCADKQHAADVAQRFREAGVEAVTVNDQTSDEDRDRIWKDLDFGTLKVVTSVGVISYGWDHPIVCVIGQASATESLSRHLQQIGRGCRPYPGKDHLLVLDHAGNRSRIEALYGGGYYEDDREWSLDGDSNGHRKQGPNLSVARCRICFYTFEPGQRKCPGCGGPVQVKHRKIRTEHGILEERERKVAAIAKWAESQDGAAKIAKYRELLTTARDRGYSDKWAAVQYNIRYQQWPRKEWGAAHDNA